MPDTKQLVKLAMQNKFINLTTDLRHCPCNRKKHVASHMLTAPIATSSDSYDC